MNGKGLKGQIISKGTDLIWVLVKLGRTLTPLVRRLIVLQRVRILNHFFLLPLSDLLVGQLLALDHLSLSLGRAGIAQVHFHSFEPKGLLLQLLLLQHEFFLQLLLINGGSEDSLAHQLHLGGGTFLDLLGLFIVLQQLHVQLLYLVLPMRRPLSLLIA